MNFSTLKLGLSALVVLSLGVAIGVSVSTRPEAQTNPVAFRDFMRDVDAGKIEEITITGQMVSGIYRDDKTGFHTYVPAGADLAQSLVANGVKVVARSR